MYFEKNRSFVSRHNWTFPVSGAYLLPLTIDLHHKFSQAERVARETAAKLLQDPAIHHEDRRVIAAKNDIVKFGQLREKCAVWAYEFERTPTREFSLGVNDINFFNGCPEGLGASQRDDWKFAYLGEHLVAPFKNKADQLTASLKDLKKDSPEWKETYQEIDENVTLSHAFHSNPSKEVFLALGDVVYLELAPLLNLGATS